MSESPPDASPDALQNMLDANREGWDRIAARGHGRTALPRWGPLTQTEDELHVLGDLAGAKVVEMGCGTGDSLVYLARHGAAELWGLDISPVQIASARALVAAQGVEARLFASAMEHDPGIPHGYFDLAVSVFSLGWAVDLGRAMGNVAAYLREGGRLVFSWEHPVFNALDSAADGVVKFARPYHQEGVVDGLSWAGIPIVLHARTIGTYVTALARAGFEIARMVEGAYRPEQGEVHYSHRWFSDQKARIVPTTMLIEAVKKHSRA
jgi:SAM-dependent methyltransferase